MTTPEKPVRLLAPAKLTLELRITGLRRDGLHTIDAEMVSVGLYDTLALTPGQDGLSVEGGSSDVPLGPDNLVNRALTLAGRRARVHLTKRIPSQAGLGGGSSDAGAILAWAGFDDLDQAASLGADVAFCTIGGRARVTGIGQIVEPLPLGDQVFTLFTPPVACPTGAIYQQWDAMGGPTGERGNDLEPAALAVVPELVRWRDRFGNATGHTPRLAGSGSTWFVEGSYPAPDHIVCSVVPGPRRVGS